MSAGEDALTPKQHRALLALLSSGTIEAAARSAGCNEKTLRLWLGETPFRAAYMAARRQAVDHAVTVLQQLCSSACLALGEALRDGRTGEKIKAARTVLDFALKGVELADLDARLAEIEAAQSKGKR